MVAPGEQPYVVVEGDTSYSKRYDMIGACVGDKVFPPIIYTPKDRKTADVQGINTEMLIQYVQDILAQACGALDRYPLYLVLDRSSIHNQQQLLDEFNLNGCQELIEVIKMPTQAAKRMSPLDNSLFHEWKEQIRKHGPIKAKNIVQLMNDMWNNITAEHLYSYYRHCGLIWNADPYFDCPVPSIHKHN